MVKNESKIIERCIESVISFVDAVCISDTGSTDSTVDIVTSYLTAKKTPFRIANHIWKNFGHNRSLSFEVAIQFCKELGWDATNSWALVIDADMCIQIISKDAIVQQCMSRQRTNAYTIVQKAGSLEYENVRLLRLSFPWKCTGPTHEYWDGDISESLDSSIIWIEDRGDGGAKADKYERDICLLTQSLEESSTNPRTWFYLGQSYYCVSNYEKAIECYKKRIELEGWFEEVWYSKYMLCKIYIRQKKIPEAEFWAQKAYEQCQNRSEPLYVLTEYFRIQSQYFKAYHYCKVGISIPLPKQGLFIETNVYRYLFSYERSILDFYVYENKEIGLSHTIDYFNIGVSELYDSVLSNMKFYISPLITLLGSKQIPLSLPTIDEYVASSPSLVQYENGTKLLNIRYVNYSLSNGSYSFRDSQGHCRTRNFYTYLNSQYSVISELFEMKDPSSLPKFETLIHGCEDIRLFLAENEKLFFSTASREYSSKYRIVVGEYDIRQKSLENCRVLSPPEDTECEKNWISIPGTSFLFVYSWYPLQIGKIEKTISKLDIVQTFQTPGFFKNIRGSSNMVILGDEIWCVTHLVEYTHPRNYYHVLLVFDKNTYKPIKYSLPFVFSSIGIEYCLSLFFEENKKIIGFIFSQNDKDPSILLCSIDKFVFRTLE